MATAKIETVTILEFNAETGETIERALTTEELAQRAADATEINIQDAQRAAKEAARASALAKLAELGLTEEEINAL